MTYQIWGDMTTKENIRYYLFTFFLYLYCIPCAIMIGINWILGKIEDLVNKE